MKVSIKLTRSDLLRFNIWVIPRMSLTHRAYLAVVAFSFANLIYSRGFPDSLLDWLIITVASVFSGFFALLAGVVVALIYILAVANESEGILGVHDYEISAGGLSERTNVNEGITRWSGIRRLWSSSSFIAFQINSYSFHVTPVRFFESTHAYDTFRTRSRELWEDAHGDIQS